MNQIPPIEWHRAEEMIRYEGLYIFGGILNDGNISNKLYILMLIPKNKGTYDEFKLEWKSEDDLPKDMQPTGQGPQGRYDHGMKKIGNNIIIFGGRKLNQENPFADSLYILKLDKLVWTRMKKKSE